MGKAGTSCGGYADVGVAADGEGGGSQHEVGQRFGNPDEAPGDVSTRRPCREVVDYIVTGSATWGAKRAGGGAIFKEMDTMEEESGRRSGIHSGSDGPHERPHPIDKESDGCESRVGL